VGTKETRRNLDSTGAAKNVRGWFKKIIQRGGKILRTQVSNMRSQQGESHKWGFRSSGRLKKGGNGGGKKGKWPIKKVGREWFMNSRGKT